ncbi:MAG: TnpV protein [Clostridia bacterium]|nr:TnpV protein [Clostridia bacterium]
MGKDGMYYPNLAIEENDQRPIGKWGRMHKDYLEEKHTGLYQQLILNGALVRHLADANERATAMLDSLIAQMVRQEDITEQLKAKQPIGIGRMNSIRSRAEEIVTEEAINTL